MHRAALAARTLILAVGLALGGAAPAAELESYPSPDYTIGIDRMSTAAAIRFFGQRAADGRRDLRTLTLLGRLHLTRYRETGELAVLDRAEAFLHEALEKRPHHAGALYALSAARGARHRFEEALSLARQAHAATPSAATLSLIGSHLIAQGRYTEAQAVHTQAVKRYGDDAALSGRAVLAELRGDPDAAVHLLERAAAASLAANQAGEAAAWYQTQLGALLLEQGRLDEAERRFTAGRRLFPTSADALAGLGAVAAARGQLDEAIDLTAQALAITDAPGLQIALGDLHLAAGREQRADAHFARAVEDLENLAPRAAGRELAMFYADHAREPTRALHLAREDFAQRPDLHGHETLAWTLYRAGRLNEARQVNDKALAFGIRDAALRYHAGLIALARGDTARGMAELHTALTINPNWHILHSEHARRLLRSIQSGQSKSSEQDESVGS